MYLIKYKNIKDEWNILCKLSHEKYNTRYKI